ncbi:MAG: M1 family aminopeptidase [bacterium]
MYQPCFRRFVMAAMWFLWLGSFPVFSLDSMDGLFHFPPKLKDGVYPRHYRPDRTVDFEHLRLELKIFMNEKRVEGTARYDFRPIHDQVKYIRFDAMRMDIASVTCPSQPSLKWTYSEDAVHVEFPAPLPLDATASLAIAYSVKPPQSNPAWMDTGMYFTDSKHVVAETPDQMFTLNEPFGGSCWFPCADYPNDRMTTEMMVTVPKEMVTLSNGLLVDSKEDGEWRTDHWKQKLPHAVYLVSLAAGRFGIVRDEWRGIPVEYYVEAGKEADARPSLGKTPAMIEFFSNYLDYPYPYEKYAQVAVRYFNAGGMEHTTATTLFQGAVLDEEGRLDNDVDGLVAHELFHQWYGDLVTCQSWNDLWLNESFATYSEPLWIRHEKGQDAFLESVLDMMEGYIGSSQGYTRPIVTNEYESPWEMFDSHSYPKGGSVLHMLRNQAGEDLFRKILNRFLVKHAPGLVSTADFMQVVEEVTGKPMDRFFEQWIYRPGHPKLKVEHQWIPERRQVKLVLTQTQEMKEGEAAFAFPLDIEIQTDGKTIRETIEISQKEETAFFDCPTPPLSVVIDPSLNVLMELEHEKPEDMLLRDLKNGSTIIVKIRAARALKDQKSDQVIEALSQAVRSESFLRLRTTCVESLAAIPGERVQNALIEFSGDAEPKLRAAAVSALGNYYKDEQVYPVLRKRFETDRAIQVVAAAARALARVKCDNAYEILSPGLERDSYMDTIRLAVMDALVDLKESRVYPALDRYARDPYPREVQVSALQGLGKLAGETRQSEQETLDLLIPILKSESEALRRAAVEGLQSLGMKDAIPHLQWTEQNDVDKNLREAAKNAIAEIRKGLDNNQAAQNAGRIDELEKKNKDLEKRLEELESNLKRLTELQEEKNKNN